MVCHIGCNLYDQDGPFIKSIEEDLEKVRHDAGKDPGGVCSYAMLVAIPMDPPYCLIYPVVYNNDIAAQNQNHFNTAGSPSGLRIHTCMCRTLLQHADLTEAHKWKYDGSHWIVPHGTEYKTLFLEITMLCNHQGLLIDHNSGKPYPMVMVGDFCLVDKIFLGTPRDSLLFNGEELAKLKRKGYQVSTFREEKPSSSSYKKKKQPPSHASGDVPRSSSKEEKPPKTSGKSPRASSPRAPDSTSSKKSSSCHSKHSPRTKEQQDKHDKESHSVSSKHKDKPHNDRSDKHSSDKEDRKSPHKCCMSPPPWPSSTERVWKECCMDDPTQTSSANTNTHHQCPSRCMSETDDQSSFIAPASTSTPNKIGNGPRQCSSSTDSRHSMTPLDPGLYGSFSYYGSAGVGHGSITPAASVAGSQQVTSSIWQPHGLFSPTLPPAADTLSADQAAGIYLLATECQALGAELAKQFQNLSRLEAVHHAMAHETINVEHLAHNAAFSTNSANQMHRDHEKSLHQLRAEANQAWKDMNDVIFSHQLRYDSQLAAFISSAEGALQAK